jgi:6-pyruvoyltetrahydropterin/6-carboxytetrahydropterin synthase
MFSFEASHQLTGLPEGHTCMRMHGHSYRVELIVRSPVVDEHGFVMDYGDFKPFQEYIDQNLGTPSLLVMPAG